MKSSPIKVAFAIMVLVAMTTDLASCKERKEKKKGMALRLCGRAFLSTWQLSCCMKNDCTRMRRSTGEDDIESIVKPNNDALISEQFAKQFIKLGPGSKRRRRNAVSQDNALEECCNEKCTLEEVSEYPC